MPVISCPTKCAQLFRWHVFVLTSSGHSRFVWFYIPISLNSSSSSAEHMRRWTGSTLVHVMAWHQAITRTNADLLPIRPIGTNFSEIRIDMQNFSFTKMHLKMSSGKWQPFCPGGDGFRLLCYQWSNPELCGQTRPVTNHNKTKQMGTMCTFLGL